ncbi:MAG: hypothetical protein KIT28_11175, partial [Rubrivivax sp.]|nr:hypothetical protein [Rubrivivax sp.]
MDTVMVAPKVASGSLGLNRRRHRPGRALRQRRPRQHHSAAGFADRSGRHCAPAAACTEQAATIVRMNADQNPRILASGNGPAPDLSAAAQAVADGRIRATALLEQALAAADAPAARHA